MSDLTSLTIAELDQKEEKLTQAIYDTFENKELYNTVTDMYQQLLDIKNEQQHREDNQEITGIIEAAQAKQAELIAKFDAIKAHGK